jgi:putative ABC transport system ATP-binding protein
MIKLRHISKSYQTGKTSLEVLHDLDLNVNQRDFLVIRGPSGSGKSTLLNILGLLDEPTKGEVELDGKQIDFSDFDKLAVTRSHALSFIFQSFNLNPVLTAYENIMVPLMIRPDIPIDVRKKRVTDWLDKVGLTDHAHRKPDELSGGQRQRVAIARAMVTEPRLVIADEPTANLDSATSLTILELMADLNKSRGTAFVFATHDPALDEFSSSILMMRDGKLGAGA